MLIEISLFFVAVALTIYLYFKWCFTYWERKKVSTVPPSIPYGNMENPVRRTLMLGELVKNYYDEFKDRGCEFAGLYSFSVPIFLPISPELVKNVLQTDFQYFTDRGNYWNEKHDPISGTLFNLGGQKWKKLRAQMSPAFTTGKMKMMYDILLQCTKQMMEYVETLPKKDLDVREIVARLTTDIIGCCAFGLECNSFKNPDAEFRKHGKNMFSPLSVINTFLNTLSNAMPKLAENLGLYFMPRESSNFFYNSIKDMVLYRQKNNIKRKDMLQLLIDVMELGDDLTMMELAAQALVFFLAGFETSSSTMTMCLYELTQRQDLQEKVREEIKEVLHNHEGKITYESIGELVYLGQCIDETLRKYPALPLVTRKCVQDYNIPGTDIIIEKDTLTYLPIMGLHWDPEYFPDPEKWNPDRFSPENKTSITPFTYIPFGEGPRICLGLRFGVVQTKMGLANLLNEYKFTLSERTKLPLKIEPKCELVPATTETIFMHATKVS